MLRVKLIYTLTLTFLLFSAFSCLEEEEEDDLIVADTEVPDPEPAISEAYKLKLMKKYAPYTYMDQNESFFPSSLDFAFPYFTRYQNQDDDNYWLTTTEPLEKADDILDFFHGDLSSAVVYVFWIEKDDSKYQMTYFYYYPYNQAPGNLAQNHVGDWEHASVRLRWMDQGDQDWELEPYQVYLSAHSEGTTKAWEDIDKVGNSPIVYVAQGSHGMYFSSGQHQIDITSKGKVFDTSEDGKIVAFDYSTKEGLNGTDWPNWMSRSYSSAGSDPIDDPNSGPIYRFGNQKMDCKGTVQDEEICTLSDGPTGPIDKPVWDPSTYEK
ncbi:MAG: Vps62-related protein [Reichenbachiella sp.]|uniref:Vps62-related protein n=1 Tax=Reichenbachiella sp. TaxID=2184521 RepID=UPI003299FC36